MGAMMTYHTILHWEFAIAVTAGDDRKAMLILSAITTETAVSIFTTHASFAGNVPLTELGISPDHPFTWASSNLTISMTLSRR
jgi:hypothetical protein